MNIYSLTEASKWRSARNLGVCLLITAVATLLGVFVNQLWQHSYMTSAMVTNIDSASITAINRSTDLVKIESSDIDDGLYNLVIATGMNADQALDEFISVYDSSDAKRNFFLKRGLYKLQGYQSIEDTIAFGKMVAEFSGGFSYQIIDSPTQNKRVILHFVYHNPEGSAELLNAFIDHAESIAAKNLANQQQQKISQLNKTLDQAVAYYKAIQVSFAQDQASGNNLINNEFYNKANFEYLAKVRYKQLQSFHLAQVLANYQPQESLFKPVRNISLANAESSNTPTSKMLIIAVAFGIGLLIAILFTIASFRYNTLRIVNE